LASYCRLSVCLSVYLSGTLCIVAKRYILRYTAKLSEQVDRKCCPRNTILHSSTFTLTVSLQTAHLLTRCCCHLALKTYCEQANRQNLCVWNSHRQHAACSRQPRTIGSFSATAGLLETSYGVVAVRMFIAVCSIQRLPLCRVLVLILLKRIYARRHKQLGGICASIGKEKIRFRRDVW